MNLNKKQRLALEQHKRVEEGLYVTASRLRMAGAKSDYVNEYLAEQKQLNDDYLARRNRLNSNLTLAEIETLVELNKIKLPATEDERSGLCYNHAGEFVTHFGIALQDTKCRVVHGYYYCRNMLNQRGKIAHAWIEFTDFKYLYDPVFGSFIPVSKLYEPVFRFSLTDVSLRVKKTQTYGPWENLVKTQVFADDVVFPFEF